MPCQLLGNSGSVLSGSFHGTQYAPGSPTDYSAGEWPMAQELSILRLCLVICSLSSRRDFHPESWQSRTVWETWVDVARVAPGSRTCMPASWHKQLNVRCIRQHRIYVTIYRWQQISRNVVVSCIHVFRNTLARNEAETIRYKIFMKHINNYA